MSNYIETFRAIALMDDNDTDLTAVETLQEAVRNADDPSAAIDALCALMADEDSEVVTYARQASLVMTSEVLAECYAQQLVAATHPVVEAQWLLALSGCPEHVLSQQTLSAVMQVKGRHARNARQWQDAFAAHNQAGLVGLAG